MLVVVEVAVKVLVEVVLVLSESELLLDPRTGAMTSGAEVADGAAGSGDGEEAGVDETTEVALSTGATTTGEAVGVGVGVGVAVVVGRATKTPPAAEVVSGAEVATIEGLASLSSVTVVGVPEREAIVFGEQALTPEYQPVRRLAISEA